ncbi:fatty acid desaturase [Nevskia sp.]|uniref:fatty acid desaturase n=1 Tax=Nevskia sp. TaxID=1929292 RepID=UPI0025E8CC26|nr:fatty acid desaturase [Nevskia sp.]
MFDYLRYYLSPLILLASVYGLYLGGPYVWISLLSLPVLAIGDALLPRDLASRHVRHDRLALVPVVLSCILWGASFVLLAWQAGHGDLSTANLIGAILSTGWIGTIVGLPAYHELLHRRDPLIRNFALLMQVFLMDGTRDIGHVTAHHIYVGTPKDHDTAVRGETLYGFMWRSAVRNFVLAQRLECEALEKRGKGRWSIGHRLWWAVGSLLALMVAMFLIGGWPAAGATLAAGLMSRFLLEAFNYFQHYGQVRREGAPICKRHVWNHLGMLTRAMTFEITNHAEHHLNSYAPYYANKPDLGAIRMPSVFMCFIAALVPPLWHHRIIMPALKRWDLEFASPEERELARAQNRAAGWPDWFTETTQAQTQSGAVAR